MNIDRMLQAFLLEKLGYKVYFARRSDRILAVETPRRILKSRYGMKPRKQYYTDDWRWQG